METMVACSAKPLAAFLGRCVHRRVRRQEECDVEGYRHDLDRNEYDGADEGDPLPAKWLPESSLDLFTWYYARPHQRSPIPKPTNASVWAEAPTRRKAPGRFGKRGPQSGNVEPFTTRHLAGKAARARRPAH